VRGLDMDEVRASVADAQAQAGTASGSGPA